VIAATMTFASAAPKNRIKASAKLVAMRSSTGESKAAANYLTEDLLQFTCEWPFLSVLCLTALLSPTEWHSIEGTAGPQDPCRSQ
jgi:hypothetical protein